MNSQNNNFKEDISTSEAGQPPKDWKSISLGEILDEVDHRVKDAGSIDIPVLSMTRHQGLILQRKKFEKRVASRNIDNYKIVRKQQIVYGFPMDEGVIFTLKKFDLGAVSPVYEVWKLKSDIVNIDYLDELLRTPLMIATYRRLTSNTVQRRRMVSKRDFERITIPLPPLTEQKAIARVLATIHKVVEAQDKIISATGELKKSLLSYLFTYGLVPIAEADQVPLKETEIGPVPEHWEVVILGEETEKPEYGYTTNTSTEKIGPKLLRITDIQNGTVNWASVPYCQCSPKEEEKYKLQPGDVLFARIGATTGKTYSIVDCPPAVFASYLIRVRCKSCLLPAYLSHFTVTQSYWNQINALKGGRLKKGINIPVLRSLVIPRPSLVEQQEMAHILSTLDKKIEVEQKRKAALQTLFHTMLHLLMTGKVRVKELENNAS